MIILAQRKRGWRLVKQALVWKLCFNRFILRLLEHDINTIGFKIMLTVSLLLRVTIGEKSHEFREFMENETQYS